jgi:DNA-binding GntR family transcriptional regulator
VHPEMTLGHDAGSQSPEGGPLDRSSIAERAAGVLRDRIIEGEYHPGARLSEEALKGELKISRNTLREAFRLLTHERLLVHEPYRGVSVRVLALQDVVDLYRVRKVIECGAVRSVGRGTDGTLPARLHEGVGAVANAVSDGEVAARANNWHRVGTADIRFHQALVSLADSPRLASLMRGILAELSLMFHVMSDRRAFHEPYLARNREIRNTLEGGDGLKAAALLEVYLDDAERQLVDAYAAAAPGASA